MRRQAVLERVGNCVFVRIRGSIFAREPEAAMRPVWQRIEELGITAPPRRTVLEVGQWQGSGSPGARRLAAGAAELAGLIPADRRVRVAVAEDGADALARTLAAVRAAGFDDRTVTVGGDCGVELGPVEAALSAYGEGLAVVWFDAHGDLNTPASSPSGAFHGMVLRTLLGDGPDELRPRLVLKPSQVVLAGVRALDPPEKEYVAEHEIAHVPVAELASLPSVVAMTGARAVYVHIDLDVLDPAFFASVGCPEPGGVSPASLIAALRGLAGRFTIAGVGLTEYEPSRPQDRDVLRAIAEALPLS
jgi:arginase